MKVRLTIDLDEHTLRALEYHSSNARGRAGVASLLHSLLSADLDVIVGDYDGHLREQRARAGDNQEDG